MDPQEAEKRYLEIAQTLGWTGSTPEIQVHSAPSSSTSEEVWDDDDDSDTPGASGGGSGLGLSVSVMAPPPRITDESIHGLSLSNDVSGLTSLLEQYPETDLDAVDEFVSAYCILSDRDLKVSNPGLYAPPSCLRSRTCRHRQTLTQQWC